MEIPPRYKLLPWRHPMESRKPKIKINNYVLYKSNGEWHEGRITHVIHEDSREVYCLFSFTTFSEIVFKTDEFLSCPAPELKRKMKVSSFADIPNKTHIPPLLLNILIVDREWAETNMYELPARMTVAAILQQARGFFLSNGVGDPDEVSEIYLGLIDTFNPFLPRFLLYENEVEQHSKISGSPAENYGSTYLLRLIYFLQKKGRHCIADGVTASIMLDYTVYLLDFLLMRFNDFF